MENQDSIENQDSPEAQDSTEAQDSSGADSSPEPGGPYEFSDEDNILFKGLATRMTALGFFLIALAALDMPALLRGEGMAALFAFLFSVTGAWSFYTAYSVRSTVETEGDDISHLMFALGSVRHLLSLAVVLVLILLVLDARELLVAPYDRFF